MNMKNANTQKKNKFFYLSFLCLIPALGILIGIFLLFFAVFEFKSKRLFFTTLITMAGGILLLKLDTAYLKHDLMYGKDAASGFAMVAANDLDVIAKELDLFKIRYGKYPDSLLELKKFYPEIHIRDPLLNRDKELLNSSDYYHYQNNGDKYILYSVGIDGIANTNDDIYPRKPLKGP